jgi:ABC-type lipoprotein release transport system permease subunit
VDIVSYGQLAMLVIGSMLLTLLAAVGPAWRAAKTRRVQALSGQ